MVVATTTDELAKAAAQTLDMKSVLCMEGGQGDASYVNNSQAQVITRSRSLHFEFRFASVFFFISESFYPHQLFMKM
jgi:hypothetical protein